MDEKSKKMLNNANSFLAAANRCNEKRPTGVTTFEWLAVPTIVNCIFSIEIYLKCLLHSNNIEIERTHSLMNLFENLPESIQIEISCKMNIELGLLKNEILKIKNSFVKWRYIYAEESLHIDLNFVAQLAQNLKNITEKNVNA